MPQALLPGYLSGPTLSVAIQGMPLAREQRKLARSWLQMSSATPA